MNESTFQLWVVDDEPAMCQGVVRALEDFRAACDDLDERVAYRVTTLESGEALLERLEREAPPDVLLLDGKLPGADGIEVLRLLGQRRLQIVTVMITAYATLENAVRATKLGAFDFLAKPFTPAELRHTVTRASREILLMRRARRLEEEKRRVRFEFLSVLAHELKSPLAAIEGYIDMLRHAPSEDVCGRMENRVQGMRKLIADLLDLTAIESGQRRRDVQPLELGELARQVADAHAAAARARGVTVSVNAAAPCSLPADRRELEMLLGNLVSNAIKYNVEGGTVTIDAADEPGAVRLRVADTGIGIAAADQARLFGEFARIRNSRTRDIEGSGLGLSIVRRIAGLYGGTVTLESEEGRGSAFTVLLPRQA
jgi:two-component system, sensor histidine kinase and response regulator